MLKKPCRGPGFSDRPPRQPSACLPIFSEGVRGARWAQIRTHGAKMHRVVACALRDDSDPGLRPRTCIFSYMMLGSCSRLRAPERLPRKDLAMTLALAWKPWPPSASATPGARAARRVPWKVGLRRCTGMSDGPARPNGACDGKTEGTRSPHESWRTRRGRDANKPCLAGVWHEGGRSSPSQPRQRAGVGAESAVAGCQLGLRDWTNPAIRTTEGTQTPQKSWQLPRSDGKGTPVLPSH
jgi:hypothetical protein